MERNVKKDQNSENDWPEVDGKEWPGGMVGSCDVGGLADVCDTQVAQRQGNGQSSADSL